MLRCVCLAQHGWYHVFDPNVRQDICLHPYLMANGRVRVCTLPLEHERDCVFLPYTERPAFLADFSR